MTNARILLMRHAEKTGDPMDPHLSQDGCARAAKLADFIPATFGIPQFLIATSISKHSARPIETLEPLSTKIGVSVDAPYADQDYSALASQLLSEPRYADAGTLIVVCWHHGNIPSMAHALRAKLGSYPNPWDADVFNQILVLSYMDDAEPKITTLTEPF
ncbi:MAG TPA: histidine phosphatase family protein [Terriglobales bacterium]